MVGIQTLKNRIERLGKITNTDITLFHGDGVFCCSTLGKSPYEPDLVLAFIASAQKYRQAGEKHFYRVEFEEELEYVLITRGEYAQIAGQVALGELGDLLEEQTSNLDKNSFYQNLLLDNLLLVDIYNKAKRLHIETGLPRVVFLIEMEPKESDMAKQLLWGMYGSRTEDFITAVDEGHLILIRALSKKESPEQLAAEASTLVDMLNTEAMIKVRVSYGTIVSEMKEVSKSYKEASMALDVGKIFFQEKSVIPYNSLGIGRLIYQLPMSLCELFMKEVFGDKRLDDLDDELLMTIQIFFENSLNVSSTSRELFAHRNTLVYRLDKIKKLTGLDIRVFEEALTLRIALMVSRYMKYVEQQN
jgi:carbohydrate diacid regulator